MCVSIVLKLNQKKSMMKKFSEGFCFKTQKHSTLGGQTIFLNNFFSVLTFNTIESPMFFWSVFFKTQEKKLLTAKNGQNGIFGG